MTQCYPAEYFKQYEPFEKVFQDRKAALDFAREKRLQGFKAHTKQVGFSDLLRSVRWVVSGELKEPRE